MQRLRPADIENYYASLKVAPPTVDLHHTVIHSSLQRAVKHQLVIRNVAVGVERPRQVKDPEETIVQAWSADEVRKFLKAARAVGPMAAALYALAVDSGMRKAELCGLKWSDVDLAAAKIRIARQLTKMGAEPEWGPLKAGFRRTITIATPTVALLRAHRKHQAEIKMKNRSVYADHDLVFAKEWPHLTRRWMTLGHPLQMNNIGQREYAGLIKTAGLRPIRFHDLRHTCATLLLQAGQPIHVVSERLGHAKVATTMEIYAHVLPTQQKDAAAALGGLLYGR